LAEPRSVLAGVVARLGVEVPEGLHDRRANPLAPALVVRVPAVCITVVAGVPGQIRRRPATEVAARHRLPQAGVEVLVTAPEGEEPRLMVDSGTDEPHLLVRHLERACQ